MSNNKYYIIINDHHIKYAGIKLSPYILYKHHHTLHRVWDSLYKAISFTNRFVNNKDIVICPISSNQYVKNEDQLFIESFYGKFFLIKEEYNGKLISLDAVYHLDGDDLKKYMLLM